MGVRLVQRDKSRMTLIDQGTLLAERGRLLLEEAEAIACDLRRRRSLVSGHLRIAAPFGFGRQHVAPLAASFLRSYPDVTAPFGTRGHGCAALRPQSRPPEVAG